MAQANPPQANLAPPRMLRGVSNGGVHGFEIHTYLTHGAGRFWRGLALPALAQQGNRISITTGGTGGVFTRWAGAWPMFSRRNVPGLQATAEVTGGSVDNLKLIGAGKSEVGFAMVDAAWEASQGLDKFKDNKVSARTLMVLYPNKMQVVTIDGTGINKLSDLKGKRVSTGSPGSGVEVMTLRVLEAMGIDPQEGHQAGAPGRRGIRQCDQGPQDRRLFLGGRRPHRCVDRPCRDAWNQDEDARPRGSRRGNEQEVRSAVHEGHDRGQCLSRDGQGRRQHRCLEHPGDQRQDERPDGV
jgi:hypothetical protein